MVELGSDLKTGRGIPINLQRVLNPVGEAAALRQQDAQIGNFNIPIANVIMIHFPLKMIISIHFY